MAGTGCPPSATENEMFFEHAGEVEAGVCPNATGLARKIATKAGNSFIEDLHPIELG
jgi:hypothetical protein